MEIKGTDVERDLKDFEIIKNVLLFRHFRNIEQMLIDKVLKALEESEKERELLSQSLNKVESDNIDLKEKVKKLELIASNLEAKLNKKRI